MGYEIYCAVCRWAWCRAAAWWASARTAPSTWRPRSRSRCPATPPCMCELSPLTTHLYTLTIFTILTTPGYTYHTYHTTGYIHHTQKKSELCGHKRRPLSSSSPALYIYWGTAAFRKWGWLGLSQPLTASSLHTYVPISSPLCTCITMFSFTARTKVKWLSHWTDWFNAKNLILNVYIV